jgi:hypothetical protein
MNSKGKKKKDLIDDAEAGELFKAILYLFRMMIS